MSKVKDAKYEEVLNDNKPSIEESVEMLKTQLKE